MPERIVVLAANPSPEGHFEDWQDGAFLGGQIRMDAGHLLAKQNPEAQICTVGGIDLSVVQEDVARPLRSRKTAAMKRHISQGDPSVANRITEVFSLPCTGHNGVALMNHLIVDQAFDQPVVRLRVLTNAYHFARAKLQTAAAAERAIPPGMSLDLSFISAESILGLSEEEIRARNPDAYDRRLEWERKGVADLQGGRYTESCFTKYGAALIRIIQHHGDQLLDRQERAFFSSSVPVK